MQLNVIQCFFHSKLLGRQLLKFVVHNSTRQTSSRIKKDDFKEISIPVPWGHISGKWWGCQDVQPMLALHGVQDSAASFDRLAPLLHGKSLLALDSPGDGRSSHIPKGFLYNFIGAVAILRFVIKDHFKWTQPVELLGHSFGSTICFVYSALYPDQVSKLITIDCGRHQSVVLPDTIIDSYKTTIEKTLEYEEKLIPPQYSYEELVELSLKARKYRLTKESSEILLSRGINRLNNGKVCLSRDVRIKQKICDRLTLENLLELASKIRCNVLSIQAETGVVKNDFKGDVYRKTVKMMVNNSPKSRHVILPGKHHIHLDNPEPVAKEINLFLRQ